MKVDELKRGNEIECRIYELEKMQNWLEDTESRRISIISNGCTVDNTIMISDNMRSVLLGMCIAEKAKLVKDFEEL